jgi:DNA polymerase-3 subunit gamma/tau
MSMNGVRVRTASTVVRMSAPRRFAFGMRAIVNLTFQPVPLDMAFQVLARKWRPQRFDDVIGQRGVTQTLRNAIGANRIAQSFVFSGPRGVGKTTTARILARALNCEKGPTIDPCGECDACVEIAQGRDMDVLEIDAATNTQVDNVRSVIIEGLGMAPARDRYKIFIIDEVHRLSKNAFDALLKSIEEPPPHVVFMMATTEIDKVPSTIQSRSQVFELKAIGVRQIADQLRRIAEAEQIQIDEAAVMLLARAGDGSMRDAQSAFDQVLGFAGTTVTAEDVSSVLGLVRRDLLIDIANAVAADHAAAIFDLAARAVESGYDLRLVLRELGRLTRDLLVLSIDPSRVSDPEVAAEAERQILLDLSRRFSGEDLMRAFDVLTRAEYEIKGSMQPRYHLEMALLRWIHLRKLTPLSDLIKQVEGGARAVGVPAPPRPAAPAAPPPRVGPPAPMAQAVRALESRRADAASGQPPAGSRQPPATSRQPPAASPNPEPRTSNSAGSRKPEAGSRQPEAGSAAITDPAQLKDAFLEEVRKQKKFFHGTVVAQAQQITIQPDSITFVFAPQHKALRTQLEGSRPLLEAIASQLAGRRMAVVSAEGAAAAGDTRHAAPKPASADDGPQAADRQQELKERALADNGVQAMLDVFAAEIKDIEEM